VRALQLRLLRLKAEAVADKIAAFIADIQSQLSWTTRSPWSATTLEERRFDSVQLLRQNPAISELLQLDSSGKQQLRVSRIGTDMVGSQTDFSKDPRFIETITRKVYFGPVYYRPRLLCETENVVRPAVSGIGVGVTVQDGQAKVAYPMENLPAAKAGMLAGDIIVALDDEPLDTITLNEVVEKLRGPANTRIKVTVTRTGHDRPIEFSITRDVIQESSRVTRPVPVCQTAPPEPPPYMTLAVAGARPDTGVSLAEINLALVQDLVAKVELGDHGIAYAVDSHDLVIAHRNRSLVNADFSSQAEVQAARAASRATSAGLVQDTNGREMVVAYAPIANLGWLAFVELSAEEADLLAR
jgi:PDZ domain-containing protein